jgi:hypothetical protein
MQKIPENSTPGKIRGRKAASTENGATQQKRLGNDTDCRKVKVGRVAEGTKE